MLFKVIEESNICKLFDVGCFIDFSRKKNVKIAICREDSSLPGFECHQENGTKHFKTARAKRTTVIGRG